ncbi:hypothetical protein ACOQFV_22135 [Nocardiopsis changdeensis]|uniref:Uncharacterized protein n=1 Tax=Nocardiopsis changdeensis TaxID=2831969 RepID=A0ABX8BGS5_9ACTN|nr:MULTISPECIES: hypothetical protein [Nocardiopsis]QUX21435.1 hypothetical protein KGD84_23915 [Nocardiopsis changdeensis]QYX37367.1 hypothetical protein K1J57_01285 [Nocardiopsis sp. MT53]
MKWFLTRLLAGAAAVAVVLAGVGVLLAAQYSGTPAAWAVSQGTDAVWVDSADDAGDLRALLDTGAVDTVYLLAGEIGADGDVTATDDLRPLVEGYPDVRALAWLRHATEGSSLLSDRFDRQARERLAPAAAQTAEGYAGVHLEIRPVTVNDPSMPALVEMVRGELGGDAVLSVLAHHVELAPGGRIPSFLMNGEEKYWSKGYLARVTEHADEVVLPGTDPGMPADAMDGGFTVRQVTEAVSALSTREEVTVRFGVPPGEQAETALAAIRIGTTRAQAPERVRLGVSLSDPADLRLYTAGWLG